MQQGSEEWLAIRCGRVTGSRVHDIVATTKSGGFAASRENYLSELVYERLTGVPSEQYVNAAMEDGSRREPAARLAYALKLGVEVTEIGFVNHPIIAMPNAKNHAERLAQGQDRARVHGSDAVSDGVYRPGVVRFRQP